MPFLLCQELFYFSFLLSVSEPLSLTSQPVQIITSAFHCQELFSFSTVVCSRALLPYGLAAGSFLWSASATRGILSRAEGIVNDFLFFSLIQTIPLYILIFQLDFTPDPSHHRYFLPLSTGSLSFLLQYPDIPSAVHTSRIPASSLLPHAVPAYLRHVLLR